jgi:hypothetical protein
MGRAGLSRLTAVLAALALAGCGHELVPVRDPAVPDHAPADAVPTSNSPVPTAGLAAAVPPQQGVPAPDTCDQAGGKTVLEQALPQGAVLVLGPPSVWGVAGLRVFALGEQVAPNGLEYPQLFTLDLNFNLWLWRPDGVYLFSDTRFWGQRATPGVTNPSQGILDFSKREFDFDGGVAWNYHGALEARAFAYSFNNLNRGTSTFQPKGYTDGIGLENRLYVGPAYADLGTSQFDVTRATFVSAGFYPSKDMVDGNGVRFKPGPFGHVYLTWDLLGPRCYLYADVEAIGTRSLKAEMLQGDVGVAVRPFSRVPRLEFRVGTADDYYLPPHEAETSLYGEVRLVY